MLTGRRVDSEENVPAAMYSTSPKTFLRCGISRAVKGGGVENRFFFASREDMEDLDKPELCVITDLHGLRNWCVRSSNIFERCAASHSEQGLEISVTQVKGGDTDDAGCESPVEKARDR